MVNTYKLCGMSFKVITNTHLRSTHNWTIKQYKKKYGNRGVAFAKFVFELPHDNPKYITWRKKLLKRPPPWSKGFTKETHKSVAKISNTFKKRKINNFALWREKALKNGIIVQPKPFTKDENLAFLIGLILGDGNIHRFKRTEGVRITLGTDKPSLWKYTAVIVEKVFDKKPYIKKVKDSNCMTITIYQKDISKRLGIPVGARKEKTISVPLWILNNKKYMVRYLRGLYEAEGSHCIHLPTSTYKLFFSNRNQSLINIVYRLLRILDFHPHKSPKNFSVQLSKKEEVFKAIELLNFRKY